MDTPLHGSQLAALDLRGALEVWVVDADGQRCMWRGRPVASHDALSEGTHDLNVRKVCVSLATADQQRVAEAHLRERVADEQLQGEFWPAQP